MTLPVPAEPRRAARAPERGWVGGVCVGLADYLGTQPVVFRAVFAVLASWRLVGVVAYLVLWLFLPRAVADAEAPGLDAARRSGLRTASASEPAREPARRDVGQVLAIGLLGGGLLWLTQVLGWGLDPLPLVVGLLASVGVGVVWWNADRASAPDTRTPDGWRRWVGPLVTHWTAVVGLVVGLTCLAVAIAVTISLLPWPGSGVRTAWGIGLTLAAAAVLAAPWVTRVNASLAQAREARLLSDARADMAAHLHDSVLQTLALIQRQADDPREVVRLARRQERELRAWLYGGQREAETLRSALAQAAQEVEDDFPVSVECVTVGDTALTPALAELVRAAREAMQNAAKHSGAPLVDVYAEVDDDTVEVFVRDRGRGFDPDAVPDDRLGVRRSIMDRMERHGGSARLRSRPDHGTEVRLEMKR